MSAESQVSAALSAYAPLTAVVSDRIYPDFLAQKIELPGVVYQRDSTEYVTTIHDGLSHGERVLVEIWCMHTTRLDAENLADLVEAAIAPADIVPTDRRPELDADDMRFSTVVTCAVWT